MRSYQVTLEFIDKLALAAICASCCARAENERSVFERNSKFQVGYKNLQNYKFQKSKCNNVNTCMMYTTNNIMATVLRRPYLFSSRLAGAVHKVRHTIYGQF